MIHAWLRLGGFAALLPALAACERPTSPSNGVAPGAAADAPEASAGGPPPPPGAALLPEPFRGRWDASAAACAGARGEMRLDVEPDRLRFHESVGRVEEVRGGTADRVEVDLAFEGEGERWTETRVLRRLPDGRLSVETPHGSAERVRCG